MNSKESQFTPVTPHRLTLGILIYVYCNYRDTDEFKELRKKAIHCKYRRDFAVLSLKLLQRPDLTLEELHDVLQEYEIPPEVLETFNEHLTNIYKNGTGFMLDTVDNFNRIIQTLSEKFLPDPKFIKLRTMIAKNSVIGYFMRRLIVCFDNLTFSEVTGVYLAFKKYYEKWSNSDKEHTSEKTEHPDSWCLYQEQWSRRQAELFIATQAALLSANEEKALKPAELQKRISNLLQSNPELAEAHFLSYLNYARLKEFCGAVDSLYHCFDKGTVFEKHTDEKSKNQRYAALNLAILHYNFGHKEEALASLKESIKIAQEANDNVCLQQALSWLTRLTNSNKDKLIGHCIQKSFELNLTYTKSLGLQTFGKFSAENAGNPHAVFEVLAKSDLINYQHNHRDLICNNYSMKSALWQFYGKSEMSSLWSQLFLHLNIDSEPSLTSFYGEGFCLAICNIANQMLLEGEYNIVNSILQFAKRRYPNEPNCLTWMLSENLFVFTRAMHHEEWFDAECAAQKIMVINKYEGYLRLAELYYYKEDFKEAHKCINDLLDMFSEEDKCSYYYIRAKILLAEIQFTSSCPDIPPGILTILENTLVLTRQYRLDYYSSYIQLHIANILFIMAFYDQCNKVLDKCLIQILAHGGRFDRARATLLLLKCRIIDNDRVSHREDKRAYDETIELLDSVKDEFKKLEAYSRVKDMLYLKAHIYEKVGLKKERNKAAYEFRKLEEEHCTKNPTTLIKYL